MAEEPPSTTGQPTAWAMGSRMSPKAPVSGALRGDIE